MAGGEDFFFEKELFALQNLGFFLEIDEFRRPPSGGLFELLRFNANLLVYLLLS